MKTKSLWLALVLGAALSTAPSFAAQSHETVRQVQQALKDKGIDPGPVDGVAGPKTHAALKQYQEQNHLTADGHVSIETLNSLGISNGNPSADVHKAGSEAKSEYAAGGHEMASGTKEAGHEYKHGDVVDGTKDLGKGIGKGIKDVAVGTGKAVKHTGKAVKDEVTK